MAYRAYPDKVYEDRNRVETAYAVLQVNQFSGSSEKWCQVQSCETGETHRTLDPDVPYANLFNAEAGYPLTLSAPRVQHARFTIEGLFLRIVFDKETTRGQIPEDTDGNKLPDMMDMTKNRAGGARFDCSEVLAIATIELVGTYDEDTFCVWKDDTSANGGETLEIEFGRSNILQLGDEIQIKSSVIYAKPMCQIPGDYSTCEFSPPAVASGAVVSLPQPLDPPDVKVEATVGGFTIDSCADIELKADESKRTGGSATYRWSLDDSDGPA